MHPPARRSSRLLIMGIALAAACHPSAHAADGEGLPKPPSFSKTQESFFENEVQPILKARCLKCHGGGAKVKGNLRLDSREAVLRGGDLGPAIVPGKTEQSRLIKAIRYEDLEMPPAGKLPAGEIAILTRWVNDGLPWSPRSSSPAVAAMPATARDRSTTAAEVASAWSLKPVEQPVVPALRLPDGAARRSMPSS